MLCYITIKPAPQNGQHSNARINGIYESEEQAWRSIGPEGPPNTTVFKWPMMAPPRLNAPVEIHDGQVIPIKHSRLLDALENALRRDEISRLYQMNEALTKHVSQLEGQLQKKPTVYIHGRDSEPAARQVRDLWICTGQKDAAEKVLRDFVNAERPSLDNRIIAVADSALAAHLNTQAQQQRLKEGSFEPNQGMAHNQILLHSGERVQFCRSDDRLGVSDGDLGQVVALFPGFRTIAVDLDRQKTLSSEVLLVPLKEYDDVDLAYATTYERATKMDLFQVFVLADSSAPTSRFVESLPCFHVEIYGDVFAAHKHFPELAHGLGGGQAIDLTADPLACYRNRD